MTDLNDLIDYLSSEDSPEDSMSISDLDGFLAGIACSPEPIPSDEWLNVALGDPDAVPVAHKHSVEALYEDTLSRLKNDQPLEPVFWEKPDGTVIAMDWCEGFMDAVKLRHERWDAFAQTDTGARLMLPNLVHMIDDQGNSMMGVPPEELDETLDTAAEAIPMAVPAIYRGIRKITCI